MPLSPPNTAPSVKAPLPSSPGVKAGLNYPAQAAEYSPAPPGEDSWYTHHTGKPFKLRIFPRELNLSRNLAGVYSAAPGGSPNRYSSAPPTRSAGDIQKFSRKSRMRLFQILNRVHTEHLSPALFLSLTASNQVASSEELRYSFLKKFVPGLKNLVPGVCWLWRMEAHRSGRVHFHMIIWSLRKGLNVKSEYYKRKIRRLWRDAIRDNSRAAELYACKIKNTRDFEAVRNYVAKYIAKKDGEADLEIPGRRWGRSKNLPILPITEIYLTHEELKRLNSIVKRLLSQKGIVNNWMEEQFRELSGWFIWLDWHEILDILRSGGWQVWFNGCRRWELTGSTEVTQAEIWELEDEYRALQAS